MSSNFEVNARSVENIGRFCPKRRNSPIYMGGKNFLRIRRFAYNLREYCENWIPIFLSDEIATSLPRRVSVHLQVYSESRISQESQIWKWVKNSFIELKKSKGLEEYSRESYRNNHNSVLFCSDDLWFFWDNVHWMEKMNKNITLKWNTVYEYRCGGEHWWSALFSNKPSGNPCSVISAFCSC